MLKFQTETTGGVDTPGKDTYTQTSKKTLSTTYDINEKIAES